MSRFIEKIVIPKSSLHHQPQPSRRGIPGVVKQIKTEMDEVLEAPVLKEEEKMKHYNQSLDRLLTFDQQLSKPRIPLTRSLPPPPSRQQQALQVESLEEEEIRSLPPTLKTKGSALLRRLKASLEWNQKVKF